MVFDKHYRLFSGQVLLLLIFLQLSLVTIPGCSVKESRTLCPCALSLVFGERDTARLRDGVALRLSVDAENGADESLDSIVALTGSRTASFRTARGRAVALAVWPSETVVCPYGEDVWIRIPEGEQCPEIWTGAVSASTLGDRAEADIPLRRNCCVIGIYFNGGDLFSLEVRGNVCGYGNDGLPAEGPFSAVAVDEASGGGTRYCTVRVPRQTDCSLSLHIVGADGSRRVFAIGNYIEASGYDWCSDDLKDIMLEIDYAATSAVFRIDRWSETFHFETVL